MTAQATPTDWRDRVVVRYGIAALALLGSLLLRWALDPWLRESTPFVLLYGAVAVAVWCGGTGPALLTAAIGFAASAMLFAGERFEGAWGMEHWLTLASYAFSAGLVILFGHALHRSRAHAEAETERCRVAEAEVKAERHRLQITLTSIGDGVLVCDTEGRVESLNPIAQSLTGWREDEARGRSLGEVFDIVSESTGLPVENPALRAMADGTIVGLANHTVLRTREGVTIPIEDSASPIVDDDGRLIGAVLVFRDARAQRDDLRERLRVEASLRQSEATLRAFFDNAPAALGLVELTDDGDILHLNDNPVTCRIFGVDPGQTAGRRASELGASAELITLWRTHYLQSAALKQPIAFEYPHELRGELLRFRATVCCIGDDAADAPAANAQPLRFSYMTEDITQRHATANRLVESEAQARLALDIARLGTWSWDVASDVVRADDRTREIVGLPDAASAPTFRLADVVGRVHRGDWSRVEASLSVAVHPDSDGRYAEEFRFTTDTDGSPRWVLAHGQALYDPDDPVRSVSRVLGSLLDITERKLAEVGLAESVRHKDEFLATLAHELRNPLAPLRNGVHLLRILVGQNGADGQPPAAAKPLAIMERQIGHMVRLIDDLLDLARVSGGKLELQRHRIDIADPVREAIETSQSLIQGAGHRLAVALPTEPVYVDADVTRLCQVIANLLNNAAKYTPEGGRIRVGVQTAEPGWVEVVVEDNGRGLAPEMLTQIFQMFAQVDRQFGRSAGGLGIGLAIARRLVQMHGGELRAASAGLGQGSRFTLRLPRAAEGLGAPVARQPVVVEDQPARSRAGCRVLIADDNLDAADSLNTLLGQMACVTRVASDGAEALRLAESMQPDIALLDIGMPGLDGHQVARRIRAEAWGRHIKLVAVTGWGQQADRAASAEAGFDLHWVKPVDPKLLDALIESVSSALAEGTSPTAGR
jgi:PAS domain S-box-containing protein